MIQGTAVYTDFKGLAELEASAQQRKPEAIRETARQFEALFVQMMMKSMREAGSAFAEERDTTYDDMFDRQISLELTSHKGIGIADLLMRQLGHGTEAGQDLDQAQLRNRIATRAPSSPVEGSGDNSLVPATAGPAGPASPVTPREDFRPDGPASFLEEIWPHAREAAEKLGVEVRAIAAQAALETGWGRQMIRDPEGVSGNNLFGIKADRRWDGDKVTVSTLEYESGLPKRQNAQFRAYSSLAEGFQDYVEFLKGNPRYDAATQGGLNAVDYAKSLQQAGYATDPDYAAKIAGILDSPRFNEVVARLKNNADVPTSF